MTNIYWPVYKNLEEEFGKLMFSIHIDDNQMNVYSSKISDLILRASTEIESISKELYYKNGGPKKGEIKYDFDALEYLEKLWTLSKKVVIISSYNCFQSEREIRPFIKDENRTGKKGKTFSWNNSYQNLKHDRAKSLAFGSIKYLFDIMAALFILNIYYKDVQYDLEKDSKASNFPIGLGSEIFAIKLHKLVSYDGNGAYVKNKDFEEYTYLIKRTDKTHKVFDDAMIKMQEKNLELFNNNPKFLKYIQENGTKNYKGNNLMWDILGKDDYIRNIQQASIFANTTEACKQLEYEAILNKNQIK